MLLIVGYRNKFWSPQSNPFPPRTPPPPPQPPSPYTPLTNCCSSAAPCVVYVISLAPVRPGCHFKTAIFNFVLLIGFFRSSNDNVPRWMPWDVTDDKSTLVQVMAWCRQATSHYLSQCWPRSPSPYDVTRPQWVKSFAHGRSGCNFRSTTLKPNLGVEVKVQFKGPKL